MYSQLAYHVNVAHLEELKRHADHRSQLDGDHRRSRGFDRRLLRRIDRRSALRRSALRRSALRRSALRRSVSGQRQPSQLLDPRV